MTSPTPEPYALRAADIARAVRGRRESYAPEWRPSRKEDAGNVFIELFGDMANEVADRIRQMPKKALIENLRVAGIAPLGATAAQAMVVFRLADAAPEPVVIPARFQLGATPARGGDMVVFETDRSLIALPGKIQVVATVESSTLHDVTKLNEDPAQSYFPFGPSARAGKALLLGLSTQAEPGPSLTLGIGVTAPREAPIPASEGALYPIPVGASVNLIWEVLDESKWVETIPIRDETEKLSHSGIIELKLPDRFRMGRPPGAPQAPLSRWLRVRIASGSFTQAPSFDFVRMNVASAQAAQTVRNEVLTQVADSLGNRLLLSKAPVLPGSLALEVDEGRGFEAWQEVADLSQCGPDDTVYSLDPQVGEVTFGDDVHGRRLPSGYRNVRAKEYRWGGGAGGAVKASGVKVLLSAASFLEGVENPRPTAGGDDAEDTDQSARHGPEAIRTHGRAVLPSDYELLALRAPGARVRRVHAMPSRHPAMPGAVIPGVVGLLIVPPEELSSHSDPPIPDEQSLRNVARHVASKLAPAGVEIVAAAPTWHWIRIEAELRLRRNADQGAVFSALLSDLRSYLHPLTGGDDGTGWPFGGPLRHHDLMRRLLRAQDVLAVPSLSIIADGRRIPSCQDFTIGENDLLWPQGSLLFPAEVAP